MTDASLEEIDLPAVSFKTSEQPKFEPADDVVIQKTLSWIQNVVIKLNLCPFAEKPLRSSKLFTSVVRGIDEEDIISVILYESILRRDESGTTVVICPEYFPNQFDEYLHLVHVMEDVLKDFDLDGYVQVWNCEWKLMCIFRLYHLKIPTTIDCTLSSLV
jgi:hypothetical protein